MTESEGVVSFGGTATGTITLTVFDDSIHSGDPQGFGTITATCGGITTTLELTDGTNTAFAGFTLAAGQVLQTTAELADGLPITGDGSVVITANGTDWDTDRNYSFEEIEVDTTLQITAGDVVAHADCNLGNEVADVEFQIASGASFTISAAQADGRTITGAGTLTVTGLAADTDLSNITPTTLNATVTSSMSLAGVDLSNVDHLTVGADGGSVVAVTVSTSQLAALDGKTTIGDNDSLTADTTAPVFDAANSTPADDGTDVAIANDIVLKFGENLSADNSDLTKVYLKDVTTDSTVAAAISISNDTVVINPTASLAEGTAYYVTWDANALKDAAGNAVAAVSDETTFNFATVNVLPTISSATLAADNSYIDITFSEGVYNTNGGSGALEATDLALTFTQGTGSATGASIATVTQADGSALAGGETTIRVNLTLTGTPNGAEKIEIKPATNAIYDVLGGAAADTQTTGEKTLADQVAPTITGTPAIASATTISLTADEDSSAQLFKTGPVAVGDATTLTANVQGAITVAAQAEVTGAAIVVTDAAGNSTTSTVTVGLGTAAADTTLAGDGSANLIFGFGGGDVITGGAGVDELYGDDGDDTFIINSLNSDDGVGEIYNGGTTGETLGDTLRVNDTTAINLSDDTLTSIEILDLASDSGTQTVTLSASQFNAFTTISADAADVIKINSLSASLTASGASDIFVFGNNDNGVTIGSFDAVTDVGYDSLDLDAVLADGAMFGTSSTSWGGTNTAIDNALVITALSSVLDTTSAAALFEATGGTDDSKMLLTNGDQVLLLNQDDSGVDFGAQIFLIDNTGGTISATLLVTLTGVSNLTDGSFINFYS